MRIRSYFANTVESAVERARQELGADALLISVRAAKPESAYLGRYEVVFGVAGAPEAAAPVAAPPAPPAPAPPDFSAGLAELRAQIETLHRAVLRPSAQPAEAGSPHPVMAEALAALLESDVDPQIAREILASVQPRVKGLVRAGKIGVAPDGKEILRALAAEVESRFEVVAELGTAPQGLRVVALVGPPGAGKTTTLVKLAILHGLTAGRSTRILDVQANRVGSSEPLRSYAAVLDLGYQALESASDLPRILEQYAGEDLVLIDTPGYGPGECREATELAAVLSCQMSIDTHLVLPASMRTADLRRTIDRFQPFWAAKLLFTRLDETNSLGPLFCEAARVQKPLSFVSTGQRVPDDLEAASKTKIANCILTPRRESALTAA